MASWAAKREHAAAKLRLERRLERRDIDIDAAKRNHAMALKAAAAAAPLDSETYLRLKDQADALLLCTMDSESDGSGAADNCDTAVTPPDDTAEVASVGNAVLRASLKEELRAELRDELATERVAEAALQAKLRAELTDASEILKTELAASRAALSGADELQQELRALRDAISAGHSTLLSRLKELESSQQGMADRFEYMKNFMATMIRHMVEMGAIPRDAMPPSAAPGAAPGAGEGRLPELRTLMALAGAGATRGN